jgi:TPR repeat protein
MRWGLLVAGLALACTDPPATSTAAPMPADHDPDPHMWVEPPEPIPEDPSEAYARALEISELGEDSAAWRPALPLLEHACAGDVADGCAHLAYAVELLWPPDPSRSAALASRACRMGSAFGCWLHGQHLEGGRGLPLDGAASLDAYRRACDLGDELGCDDAGRSLAEGRSGPPDPDAARAMWERGCALGLSLSCTRL